VVDGVMRDGHRAGHRQPGQSTLNLAPIPASQIDSSSFQSFDLKLSRPIFTPTSAASTLSARLSICSDPRI
jgi:hypothetical protein